MRESVINHPAKQKLALLKEDLLKVCDGQKAPALMLGILEYWTNIKLEMNRQLEEENRVRIKKGFEPTPLFDLWIFKTYENWSEDSLGLIKRYEISDAVRLLEEKGLITRRQNTREIVSNPSQCFDRTMYYRLEVPALNETLEVLYPPDRSQDGERPEGDVLTVEVRPSNGRMRASDINGRETTTERTTERERGAPVPATPAAPAADSHSLGELPKPETGPAPPKVFTLTAEDLARIQQLEPYKDVGNAWAWLAMDSLAKGYAITPGLWAATLKRERLRAEPIKAFSADRNPSSAVASVVEKADPNCATCGGSGWEPVNKNGKYLGVTECRCRPKARAARQAKAETALAVIAGKCSPSCSASGA